MVIRPDPKNIIKQLIEVQNFDIKTAIKEQRTQPFDFFIKKKQKALPSHLTQTVNNDQAHKPKLFDLKEALKIVTSYLFYPTPIYMSLKLNWPSSFKFPKTNRLPVNPKIILESKSPVVMVFAEGVAAENCRNAGADYVGGVKLLQQIQKYGMIPVDDCFCEMKQLPAVIKMAPVLGKYTPSVKRSTAYENIAPFIRSYKQWNYLTFTAQSLIDNGGDKESLSSDVFYDCLKVQLANSNREKEFFSEQISHVLQQIGLFAQPPETTLDEEPKPMVHHCVLSAKNAPSVNFDPFCDSSSNI